MTHKEARRRFGGGAESGNSSLGQSDAHTVTSPTRESHPVAARTDSALRADLRRLARERDAIDAQIDAIERELRQRAGLQRMRGHRPVAARDVSVDVLMPLGRTGDRR